MVVGDFITVAKGVKEGWGWYKDKRDEVLDVDELDACRQRFAETLEKALINAVNELPDFEHFISKYNNNRSEILSALADTNITNVDQGVTQLTERMTELILEELDTTDIDNNKLQEAVETAYREALDEYLKQTSGSHGQRLNFEMKRVFQEDIESINEYVGEIYDQLRYSPELLGRYEPFTVINTSTEWKKTAQMELTDGKTYFQSYHDPSGFDDSIDAQHVLVCGRKGTGKTRTLYELLTQCVETHGFDKVVIISDSFTKERDIGSLTSLDYSGDVLLVWDDAHFVSNKDVLKNTIAKLSDRLNEDDHTLWTRVTVRRERLDDVYAESEIPNEPTNRKDPSGYAGIRGQFDNILHVDTTNQFNSTSVSNLVEEALNYYNLSAEEQIKKEFAKRILEYEPTPEYINSACKTIANETDVLTEAHIQNLPDNTDDIWKEAYSRLRDSKYGDSRRAILKSIALLNWIDADVISYSTVRVVYRTVFDGTNDFSADVEYLDSRGWISVTDSKSRIQIHAIRLDSVDIPVEAYETLDKFSTALEQIAENALLTEDEIADDYPSVLNGNFAHQLFETHGAEELQPTIEKHFRLATMHAAETPSVHQSYAEYLEQTNCVDRAHIQHLIAKEIRPTEHSTQNELRQFIDRVSDQLTDWEVENTSEDEKRRDINYELVSDRDQVGEHGSYQTHTTKCEICARPIEPGRYRCRVHDKPSVEPPTKRERAEALVELDKRIAEDWTEIVTDIEKSEETIDLQPPQNLLRKLREINHSSVNDWIETITNDGEKTGFVTKMSEATEVLKNARQSVPDPEHIDEFIPADFSSRGLTVGQELLSEDELPDVLDDQSLLGDPFIIFIDNGCEKILGRLDLDDISTLVGLSEEEMVQICREEMSGDAHLEKIRPQIVGTYCHIITYPGAYQNELMFMNTDRSDTTVAIQTATEATDSASSEASTDPTYTRRVTGAEILSATKEIDRTRSIFSSGDTLLPTGKRVSQFCTAGLMTEPIETDHPVERGWVLHDPFGESLHVYERPLKSSTTNIESIDFPATVLLTATPETITLENGEQKVILKLDELTEISLIELYVWTIETCQQTIDRIKTFDNAPGISQLSRYKYGINSLDELDEYKNIAEDTLSLLR